VHQVDELTQDGVRVVAASGELDAADPSWADEIGAALDAGSNHLVIDLRNVTFIDSSVVRELLLAYKRVADQGWIRLVYTHHLISRVIQICGLGDTFPQFTTVEAALRSRTAFQRSAASGDEMTRAENERQLSRSGGSAHGRSDDD
jgi:stage II sporulation protein AA (anti-sigma F factor antagonist)